MARKVIKKSSKAKVQRPKETNKRPRQTRRGWLVLSRKKSILSITIRLNLVKLQHLGLILIGIIMVGLWANHFWQLNLEARANQKILLKQQLQAVNQVQDLPHPTHIFIQWFVDSKIVDGTVEGNNWTLSPTESIYISQSARPGTPGNIILYGHNTREVMGNIRALKGSEKIKLTLSDGSERWYQVREMHQVTPEEIKYIQPTTTETLTLYTCAGFADRDRFVVQAVPLKN